MPRLRQRVCLEQALKLDLVQLMRTGLVVQGASSGPHRIHWRWADGRIAATGIIQANLQVDAPPWLDIQIDARAQRLTLTTISRPLGGRQYFCQCPVTNRRALVLWLPPGATRFASRHA